MNEPVTYEIVVRGHASEHLLPRFRDDFAIVTAADGQTRLVGDIRDAAHLHGVIHHLASLAIELVSLTPVGPDASEPPTPTKETP